MMENRTVLGWNQEDIKDFKELLVKANVIQLNAAFYEILVELYRRQQLNSEEFNDVRNRMGLPPLKAG